MNIKKKLQAILLLMCLLRAPAFADFAISLSPSAPSFAEGSSGYVDVLVSSNNADALDSFSLNFSLSNGFGLEFVNPQAESHLANTGYVFYNRSNSVINSLPSTVVNSSSSMNMSDLSDDGLGGPNPFTVGGVGSESLLARLNLNALLPGTYTLDLLATSSLSDVGFNNFLFNTPSLDFTVTAVPEPSSIGGAIVLALGGWHFRRKRSKRMSTHGIATLTR